MTAPLYFFFYCLQGPGVRLQNEIDIAALREGKGIEINLDEDSLAKSEFAPG